MPRRVRGVRRTPSQVRWDATTMGLMRDLGRALKEARNAAGLTQQRLAALAGVSQGTISWLEQGKTATISLLVLARAAEACGSTLHAYLAKATGTQQPRDIAHLRAQALIVDVAAAGGWTSFPEAAIDAASDRSRSIDVLLERARTSAVPEVAVIEVLDWVPDLGASFRDWDRRLARVEQRAVALRTRDGLGGPLVPQVSGCWVLRATKRNRALVRDLRALFAARFPASGAHWLGALESAAPMPSKSALLWISVRGDRMWPSRL